MIGTKSTTEMTLDVLRSLQLLTTNRLTTAIVIKNNFFIFKSPYYLFLSIFAILSIIRRITNNRRMIYIPNVIKNQKHSFSTTAI